MGAADPLKGAEGRRRFRAVTPPDAEASPCAGRRARRLVLKATYRPSDANFFCWKYGVWYNLMDCCYRHDRRTFTGCTGCGQGAGNLKANLERYRSTRDGSEPRRRASGV